MAKSTPAQSLLDILSKAEPVEPGSTNRRRGSVDIPDAVHNHVKVMAETGKVISLDITDEGHFNDLKAMYLDAAYAAGHSATVVRTYDNVRDTENRKWIGTRISVGVRRGRNNVVATNGTAGQDTTDNAQSASESDKAPAFDRGW